ncbi:MAG: phosphatidate cytidylyltransferase [Flavobacteriia bacterium]|nr:phosphatidate cytidylyltransferase [Flavobacteriia bacterium]
MDINFPTLLILSASFLGLFFISELLYHRFKVDGEVTRKISHVGTGLIILVFPFVLQVHWEALILCVAFILLLLLSMKFDFFQGINKVKRKTYGSLLYPIAVYVVFRFYLLSEELISFYIPVLLLALSDPLAALVGRRWPIRQYSIRGDVKSVMGAIVFFLSAFLISSLLMMSLTDLPPADVLSASVFLALLTAAVEAVSGRGVDNLTIPLAAMLVLWASGI